MPNRDEVIEKLKQQLDMLNTKLAELETKADHASGEAKAEYQERIQHLKEMAQPAKDKLAELRDAGEGQWDKVSMEADKYYKALVHSFNYFKSQVK
jgi:vacuolar-type H+-ATPase subunit H